MYMYICETGQYGQRGSVHRGKDRYVAADRGQAAVLKNESGGDQRSSGVDKDITQKLSHSGSDFPLWRGGRVDAPAIFLRLPWRGRLCQSVFFHRIPENGPAIFEQRFGRGSADRDGKQF